MLPPSFIIRKAVFKQFLDEKSSKILFLYSFFKYYLYVISKEPALLEVVIREEPLPLPLTV